MKNFIKYIVSIVLIFIQIEVSAQNLYNGSGLPVPNGSGNITMPIDFTSVTTLPALKFNYVRTYIPLDTMRSIPAFNSTVKMRVHTTTIYKGGLWNPIMTVTSTGINKDIVTVADDRPSNTDVSLLPYPVNYHSKFQLDAYSKQKLYYQTLYPLEGQTAYGKTVISSNQGLLTTNSYLAGKAFVGYQRGAKEIQSINAASEVYKIESSAGTLCKNGFYNANELRKTRTETPNGGIVLTYVDRAKKLICKSVFAGGTKWLQTYYVYNELGKLTYVIPPKAAQQLATATCISDVGKLCTQYQYNAVGEIISKTSAGKSNADITVFDNYRRIALLQTALMKGKDQWQFNIYDQSNRIVVTGVYEGNVTAAYWNGILNGTTTPLAYSCPTNQTLEYWLVNGLSNYNYPTTLCACEIQSYNYYDRYNAGISGLPAFSDSLLNFCLAAYETPKPNYLTHGRLIASKTKVLEDNGNFPNIWITTVMYYDEKGRMIQSQTLNPWNTNKWDLNTTQYNFSGQAILTISTHFNPTANKKYTRILNHNFFGSYTGRLDSVYQKIDNRIWQPIFTLRYDDIGRVVKKWLGNIEEQNFSYNIRGQITGINAAQVMDTATYPTKSYRSDIFYETGFDSLRYDGGIAGFRWKTSGSPTMYYGYTYDKANRMLAADYRDYSVVGGTYSWNKDNRDFSVSNLTYDANGNMLTMNQRGYDMAYKKADMDILTYNYDAGNQVTSVGDAGVPSPIMDFEDGNTKDDDYTYDADGNLASDANKSIKNINYNIQDLPYYVKTDAGDDIFNTYDAAGTLLRKEINDNTGTNVWTYWGAYVYRNDSLIYTNHPEGKSRYLADSNGFKYDYYVKDHLGNVRTVTTADVTDSTGAPHYRAGFELLSASAEEALFDNIGSVRDANPTGTPLDLMSARLNGSDASRRVAASILLHGMTGDQFSMDVAGYYEDSSSANLNTYATGGNMLSAILGALTGNIVPGSEGATAITTKINNLLSTTNYSLYEGLKATATDPAYPRAYMNILVFDEDFNLKTPQSLVVQLRGGPFNWTRMKRNLALNQNGYVVGWLSHESNTNTYFDAVDLVHIAGRLQEQQHYYPHGLRIEAGVASSVREPNKNLYQGKLMQEELGLQLYDFHARQYDPQIGRFWGLDPADQFPSGYTGMSNDPANNIDPSGMYAINNGGNLSTRGMEIMGQIKRDREFWLNYDSGIRLDKMNGGGWDPPTEPEQPHMEIVLKDANDINTQVLKEPGKPDVPLTKAAEESTDDCNFETPSASTAFAGNEATQEDYLSSSSEYTKDQKEIKAGADGMVQLGIIKYDVKSFEKFYDEAQSTSPYGYSTTSKDPATGKDKTVYTTLSGATNFTQNDMAWKPSAEKSANIVINGDVATVGVNRATNNDMTRTSTPMYEPNAVGVIHNHPAVGVVRFNSDHEPMYKGYLNMSQGPSGPDLKKAPVRGYYNIIIDRERIYFYNDNTNEPAYYLNRNK
jgi:RHS repeat-associated protein